MYLPPTAPTMETPPSSLAFPHSRLTPIIGTPTNSTVKLLTKQVYTNARAIPSTRGGGNYGHLGLVMPAAEYLTLAGAAFTLPVHPGDTPTINDPKATQYIIAEEVRVFKTTIAELTLAATLREELKKQILTAVDQLYLDALDDATFGFAQVSVYDMLTHLSTTYGTITRTELEANRASIATLWTPGEPIEQLWGRLREVQRIATAGGDPISDLAILDLTFLLFESTGVFTAACAIWRSRSAATKTVPEFRAYFTAENKDRLRNLTTSQAGFHGANATATVSATKPSAAANPSPTLPNPRTASVATNDGKPMYYCWTHGLGFNKTHNSTTCSNPAAGHCITATVTNMQGGNNTIMSNRRKPKSDTQKPDAPKPTAAKTE